MEISRWFRRMPNIDEGLIKRIAPHHALLDGEQFNLRAVDPPNSNMISDGLDHRLALFDALTFASDSLMREDVTFGIELKAAYGVEFLGRKIERVDHLLPFEPDAPRRLIQLFLRPAFEPIALLFKGHFLTGKPDVPWERIGQSLNPLAPLRTGPISNTRSRNGSFTTYPDVESITGWETKLNYVLSLPIDPLARAFVAHALVIIHHPLEDGNGRLARAAFWGSLFRSGIRAPLFPLAIVIYQNPSWFASSYRELSLDGDWNKFLRRMDAFLSIFELLLYKP